MKKKTLWYEIKYTSYFFIKKDYTLFKIIKFYFNSFVSGAPLRIKKENLELVEWLIALEKEAKRRGWKV